MRLGRFDGSDIEPPDIPPLSTQHLRVRAAALAWHGWFAMEELAHSIDEPAGSTERQVRYLRAERFGSYLVEKRRRGESRTWEYRVVPPVREPTQQDLL